jgi:hypothetical protein
VAEKQIGQSMPFNLRWLVKRPLSALAGVLSIGLILYELIQIARGELYAPALGYIDGTTVIELAILGVVGTSRLRAKTDLQAVAFTLVAALSFIFSYEAVYKWSFYMPPFRLHMPPVKFRQMLIQIGIALGILTGFAVGFFSIKRQTLFFASIFVMLWIFWLLVGYPQITGKVTWPTTIPIELSYGSTYLLNRATKLVLWMAYLSIFPNGRRIPTESTS